MKEAKAIEKEFERLSDKVTKLQTEIRQLEEVRMKQLDKIAELRKENEALKQAVVSATKTAMEGGL